MSYLSSKTSNLDPITNYVSNGRAYNSTEGWATYAESDAVTFQDAGDTVTLSSHGLSNGTVISFTSITSTTGISINTLYYVVNAATNTFQVATSVGGSALALTTNGSGTLVRSIPKLGTGGSPALTFTRNTSSPLRQSADFRLAKGAANHMGQGVSYDFTIDDADLAKVLTLSFDYELVTATGTYANADLVIYLIQDPTGTPVVIQPAGYTVLSAASMLPQRQITTFQTSSSVKSYRLCVHVASVSATAYTLAIDNVSVGPQIVQYGAPVTDWQDYTPVITAVTTNPTLGTTTVNKARWRRVGDSMQIEYQVKQTSAGTAGSGLYFFALPSGYAVDSSKLSYLSAHDGVAGAGNVTVQTASTTGTGTVYAYDANRLACLFVADTVGAGGVTWGSANFAFSNAALTVTFTAQVPILGWSSTVQMSNDTDTRVVAASYKKTSNQTVTGNTTDISFDSKNFDTHNAWSGSAYVAPVPGFYSLVGSMNITTATSVNLAAFVNGTVRQIVGTIVSGNNVTIGGIVYLEAGQSLSIRSEVNITILGSSAALGPYLAIQRISGPSAIAASETVAASYWVSSNQSVTAGVTNVNFDTREFDTHGAVTTGSSWAFNAPISGTYCFALTVETNGNTSFAAYKNGTIYKYIAVNPSANVTGGGSVLIRLNAGDSINIRTNATVTVRGQATLPALPSQIHIHRIGS